MLFPRQRAARFSQLSISSPIYVFIIDGFEGRRNPLLGPPKEYPFPGQCPEPRTNMLDAPKVLFQSNNSKYRATINLQKGLKIFSNAVESDKGPRPESSEQFSPGVMNFKLPLEVQIIECPALVKRVMAEHLKDMDWDSNSVYIVNITSVTSPEPDDSVSTDESKTFSEEIRQIFNAFLTELADKFCAELRRRNYWADYIDPKSGQQRGCGPIQALLQYDEELAESGFKISPLGLCKVIDNVKWDKCLVGTIYAAAPVALIMNAIKESINEFILDNVVSGFKCKLMMHIANDEDMSNKK